METTIRVRMRCRDMLGASFDVDITTVFINVGFGLSLSH